MKIPVSAVCAAGLLLLCSGCGHVPAPVNQDMAMKQYIQGLLYESEGSFSKACELYRLSAENSGGSAFLSLKLGNLALKEKKIPEARSSFEKAVGLEPRNVEGILGLGLTYFLEKKFDRAEEYFERGLALDPSKTFFRVMLTDMYVLQGQYRKALPHYRTLLADEGRDSFQIHFNYAAILEKLERYDEAEKEYLKTLEMAPQFWKGHMSLGLFYGARGNHQKEQEYYSKAIEINPKEFLPYILLVNASLEKREFGKIKDLLEKGIANGIEKTEFYQILGNVYSDEKSYEKALECFRKAGALGDSSQLRFSLGVVYDKMGQKDKMETEMRKAVEMDPKNGIALNYLGYSFLSDKKNIPEAYEMITKAVALEPDNGAFLDSLGWACFLMKKYPQAQKALERAASLEKDAEIYEHLGYLYFEMKDYHKAVLWWTRSLELQKKPEIEQMIKKALDAMK